MAEVTVSSARTDAAAPAVAGPPQCPEAKPPLDTSVLKADFPVLAQTVHGKRVVYLDSASSSQRPQAVLDAMDAYYQTTHANVHRGVYALAEEADRLYEAARLTVGRFIGAADPEHEVIFTKNATEAINLVAGTWARANLGEGDAVLLTDMEHHANVVPWLMLAEERGVELRWLGIDDDYRLDLTDLERLVDGVKLVACTAMSNVLGTVTPMAHIARVARDAGALVLADGAQSVPHVPTDVIQLGLDFLAFSAHKMLGPTGTGVLWARRALLESMPPFLGGGSMISEVTLERSRWNEVPHKFEAGTPDIVGAVGWGAAVDYLEGLGMEEVFAHERALVRYALDRLDQVDGLTIYGPSAEARSGVVSFNLADIHPHDLATILDHENVAIRAGHHCTQPLMRRLGVSATSRASLYIYNTREDVDRLIDALHVARSVFKLGEP
jgi:cysteine desulfurase/selenocysteine lyase